MPLPAVRVCEAPDTAGLETTDLSGRTRSWLVPSQPLFATVPNGGSVALLTGYCALGAEFEPVEVEVRRLDRDGSDDTVSLRSEDTMVLGLSRASDGGPADDLRFEVLASVRGRGEIRFIDTRWAGRLGYGRSIDALSIAARGRLRLPPVEYKALTAGGDETAWTEAGSVCGTPGATPLLGFALRQRAGSGPPLFDCEYRGCFQSGATVGPARNGAPCLSPAADDPLEGVQIRLVRRPSPPSAGSEA